MSYTIQKHIEVQIQYFPHGQGLEYPAYALPGSSGMDLRAAIHDPLTVEPGHRVLVPTGLAMAIPEGLEGQVRPRSGLALHHGLTVLNSPGTIDAGYRGEIQVILIHLGHMPFQITRGQRIAQLVLCPVIQAQLIETNTLLPSERGDSGFGSTGTS